MNIEIMEILDSSKDAKEKIDELNWIMEQADDDDAREIQIQIEQLEEELA